MYFLSFNLFLPFRTFFIEFILNTSLYMVFYNTSLRNSSFNLSHRPPNLLECRSWIILRPYFLVHSQLLHFPLKCWLIDDRVFWSFFHRKSRQAFYNLNLLSEYFLSLKLSSNVSTNIFPFYWRLSCILC